jgi:hypothetical protein
MLPVDIHCITMMCRLPAAATMGAMLVLASTYMMYLLLSPLDAYSVHHGGDGRYVVAMYH